MKVDRACIRIHVYTGACTSHFPENAHVPAHTVPELLHRVFRAAWPAFQRASPLALGVSNFLYTVIAAVT